MENNSTRTYARPELIDYGSIVTRTLGATGLSTELLFTVPKKNHDA